MVIKKCHSLKFVSDFLIISRTDLQVALYHCMQVVHQAQRKGKRFHEQNAHTDLRFTKRHTRILVINWNVSLCENDAFCFAFDSVSRTDTNIS